MNCIQPYQYSSSLPCLCSHCCLPPLPAHRASLARRPGKPNSANPPFALPATNNIAEHRSVPGLLLGKIAMPTAARLSTYDFGGCIKHYILLMLVTWHPLSALFASSVVHSGQCWQLSGLLSHRWFAPCCASLPQLCVSVFFDLNDAGCPLYCPALSLALPLISAQIGRKSLRRPIA